MAEPQFPKHCKVRGCFGTYARKVLQGCVQLQCSSTGYHRAWLVSPAQGDEPGPVWEFTVRGKSSLKGKPIEMSDSSETLKKKPVEPAADSSGSSGKKKVEPAAICDLDLGKTLYEVASASTSSAAATRLEFRSFVVDSGRSIRLWVKNLGYRFGHGYYTNLLKSIFRCLWGVPYRYCAFGHHHVYIRSLCNLRSAFLFLFLRQH